MIRDTRGDGCRQLLGRSKLVGRGTVFISLDRDRSRVSNGTQAGLRYLRSGNSANRSALDVRSIQGKGKQHGGGTMACVTSSITMTIRTLINAARKREQCQLLSRSPRSGDFSGSRGVIDRFRENDYRRVAAKYAKIALHFRPPNTRPSTRGYAEMIERRMIYYPINRSPVFTSANR